ncbi:SDR family NAD(P)-dependent oxidoreductase [Nostoc sp. ChiQUE01b]|uniref:SDR family NAD(P)-dependent oxidoreductase n=1 Tax=Nostoc sp. ChiQUE01b TaxID=3075376 RepID=UPI002AD3F77D|nr:SDR family NAD(P)-dependent oxidoreductase [Nostoc sp. ChiQUE01b]MDZ8261488.1 SDR family NAD(P)-dependent oxidoreductase [Nostoc sp. ChiQUE01b]
MNKSNKGAVVITGTSTGLGRATALLLDKQGYRVFAGVRTEKDAESLRQAASGNLTPIIMDITKTEQIKSALDFVSLAVGETGLFALINNAVVAANGAIECTTIDDIKLNFEVNIIGQIVIIQAFLPLLRKARGRIINISGGCGRAPIPYFGILSATKAALESITDCLRMELRSSGIEVLSILPMDALLTPEQADKQEINCKKLLANISPEHQALYGKNHKIHMEDVIKSNRETGAPLEIVTEVILEALEAKKPKRQYFPTRSPWDSRLFGLCKRLLPHQYFYDNVFFKSFGYD